MVLKQALNHVVTFQNELGILSLGVVAAIFTFGFVQGVKRTVLTPVIMAYMVPAQTSNAKMISVLPHHQRVMWGEFIAELIQWLIFMFIFFVIWQFKKWH
jgi:large-conductance mechanosensitive channel